MSKTVGILAFVGVAACAAGFAFWALRGDGPHAPDGGGDVRRDAPTAPADPGTAGPGGAARTRAGGPKRAGDPDADARAVGGTVVGPDGRAVAGAEVACFRVPDGEPSDEMRRARAALRGLMDDEGDIDAIVRQMGGAGETPRPEQMQRMMRAGQRVGARLAADPGAMGRVLRMGRDFSAGMEDDADLPAAATTSTGADGAFRFDDLAPGRVELRVKAPRFQRRKMRADVGDVKVRVEVAPAGVVAGEVRRLGRPVPGATLRFRSGTVRAGGDGRFSYDGARPPKEPVVASAPGCLPRGVWAIVEPGKDGEELVIDLEPAGRVTGRVASRDGSPVAGALVTIAPDPAAMMQMFMPGLAGESVPVPPPEALTRADGTYEMDAVPARTVRLRAEREGWLGVNAEPIRVPLDGVVENVDFTLARESVIEGRVTEASGAPVADAEVRVEVPAEGLNRMMAQMMGGVARVGRSGPDGAYRVGGLPDGERAVTVEAEGFLRMKVTLSLAPESAVHADFVLGPGFRVAGHVVAPDGSPVAGATVGATAKGGDRPANPFLAQFTEQRSATSDASGAFTLTGLQEGPYDLTATAPRYLEGTLAGVAQGAEDVTVRLGAAATLRGVVVAAETGAPVANASVFRKGKASRPSANPMLDMFTRDASVTTGADGTFEIPGLAPGPWEVWARSKGYADSVRVKVQAVADAPGEVLTLALPPGSALAGRVVRKADGSPVEGALVWVRLDASGMQPPDANEILGQLPSAPEDAVSATTGADGTFVLDGLTPGKVTVEVRAVGCAPRTLAATEVPASNVSVEMSQGGAFEGVVFDKEGRRTEGATVILQQGMMGVGFLRTATSDREGSFRIERLPPGTYTAMLMDPESPMGMGGAKSVSIRDGETTRHEFGKRAAGSPVEGSVVADGKPVEGATVMLLGGSGGMQVGQTDAAGRFRFDHAEAGEYSVMVQSGAMGGGSQSAKVKVGADGSVASVALELSTLAVEGTVVDAETGKPVGFAQAVLLESGGSGGGGTFQDLVGRQKGQAITDAQGRFRIAGVPRGSLSLRVTAPGFAETEIEGVSAGGQAIRVALTRGVEFTVTVLGPDGKPVAGANVVPEDPNGREGLAFDFAMTRTTGADGVAKLRLQPGRYVLHARATGFPDATAAVDAAQAQATIKLEAGGTIEVVVRAGTAPVANASVKLLDAQGKELTESMTLSNFLGAGGTTDADGRARREGLRAGTVTVVVRTPAGKELKASATVRAGETTTVEVTE